MFSFCVVEMFVSHKTSLKTDTLPGNIQLACNGDLFALPHARGAIAIWNLGTESVEVFLLLFFCVYQFITVTMLFYSDSLTVLYCSANLNILHCSLYKKFRYPAWIHL